MRGRTWDLANDGDFLADGRDQQLIPGFHENVFFAIARQNRLQIDDETTLWLDCAESFHQRLAYFETFGLLFGGRLGLGHTAINASDDPLNGFSLTVFKVFAQEYASLDKFPAGRTPDSAHR